MRDEGATGAASVGGRDLVVGMVYRFGEYLLTLDDVVEFAQQWDPQYFHTDPEAAAESVYRGLIASGIQTLGIMQRLTVDAVYRQWATIAGRSVDDVRFLRPVRPSDVLTGSARIDQIDVDEDRGRADVVLTIELTVADRPVLTCRCSIVVHA